MNGTVSNTVTALTVLVCRVAIGATGLQWLRVGDDLSFAVATVALLLTFLPARVIRDTLLYNATTAATSVLLAAHIVLGMQHQYYETSILYDKAMHCIGSGAVAGILMLFVQRYCSLRKIEMPAGLLIAFVFAGTLSAGTLWELFEFAIDRTGLFYAQRGLHDTMIDLLADAVGAVLAAVVLTVSIRSRRSNSPAMTAAIQST